MKCIVILVVAVLALTHAQLNSRDEFEKYHNDCQNDPASRIGEGQAPNAFEAQTLCIAVKMGIISPNGDVDPKGLRTFLERLSIDAEKIEKIVADCSKRHGGSAVDAASGMMGCLTKWTAPSPPEYQ